MGAEYSWAVDALIIVLVVVSAYLAMVRGLIRELFALGSWVVAFVAAFFLTPTVQPMLANIPAVGSIAASCDIGLLIAFVLVFGAALIIAGVVIWLLSSSDGDPAVGVIDQILGFIYGAVRGVVLVAVLLIVYNLTVGAAGEEYAAVEESATYPYVNSVAKVIQDTVSDDFKTWVDERREQLKQECEARQGDQDGQSEA